MASLQHLVVPGQVLAVSNDTQDSFLRGHGTFIDDTRGADDQRQSYLIASVVGVVQRVNKLVSVIPVSDNLYNGNIGDLVVGRVVAVATAQQRWRIQLQPHARLAALPLSGVHLPGGVQRIRTAADARDMRSFLQQGDLVSAEVHKKADNTYMLHTRSARYGKLENGCLVTVPPKLVPRRKNHFTNVFLNKFQVLWGCNGMIWIQRKIVESSSNNNNTEATGEELSELLEQKRREHAETPLSIDERQDLARLRNAIQCLAMVYAQVSPEATEKVYNASESANIKPADMLLPHIVIVLTESCRETSN